MDVIPFNMPYTSLAAYGAMADAARSGHLAGDGYFTKAASARLCEITGAPHVLLTTSCTHALEMCGLLLGLKPGDEVIMPSFTFVSTANAFALRGAHPIFVDIRPDTFNIDERLLESAITDRTRAIVVVHYAGVGCEMDDILAIADRRGIPVIEDNAHGLGGTYRGRPLGSLGDFATLSFHETKNIQCGEGGALLVNDVSFYEDAEIVREKGTNRSRFFRGQVDKYTWVAIGSSYLPSEILAAYLSTQLDEFDDIQKRRLAIWHRYREELLDWSTLTRFRVPDLPHRSRAFRSSLRSACTGSGNTPTVHRVSRYETSEGGLSLCATSQFAGRRPIWGRRVAGDGQRERPTGSPPVVCRARAAHAGPSHRGGHLVRLNAAVTTPEPISCDHGPWQR